MTRIDTFRSPQQSLFQSLVEEVAGKLEAKLALARGDSAGQPRMGSGHVAADVAQRIAEYQAAGQPVPGQPPPAVSDPHGDVAATLWTCAKLAAEALAEKTIGNHAVAREKRDELAFSTCDPHWAEAVTAYLRFIDGRRKGEIPYVPYREMSDFVIPDLPADATIALVGDWGTGTADAIELMRQVAKHQPDVLIHLGDIYYSGTECEAQKVFLDVVDEVFERDKNPVAVYNLTGNHDMYSGGTGYYWLLPKLNPPPLFRPEQAQQASYFALRTEDGAWQFLGMDTGLHDDDPFTVATDITYLDPKEELWHLDKVRSFSQAGGRTVLLSHHQPFSAHEDIGGANAVKPAGEESTNPKLMTTYRKLQAAAAEGSGDLAAWFWGHEHNLCVYEPFLGVAKGRCLGHGAIPAFVDSDPDADDPQIKNPPQLVDDPRNPGKKLSLDVIDHNYAHGFAILRLDGATKTAKVSYYQETDWSTPMYEEEL